jgi:GNAT superfamily N-acetyltransferase
MNDVVRADDADAGRLSQVIADAFIDLPPARWLIADPVARRDIFPGYFLIFVEHALATGVVHTTTDRVAVALWLFAGDGHDAGPADYEARLAAQTRPWTDRFIAFDAALDQCHPVGVPHHYLAMMAVRPDRQGAGTGAWLLRSYHSEIDKQDGAPAYLEASAPRGAVLYRPFNGQEWEELFLDLMAYLDPKGEGDNSMPGNRQHMPRRMGWRAGRSA